MFIPTRDVLRRVLMLSIAGTRGGSIRLKILMMLERRSRNINEVSQLLGMDYKSVQHHMRVLEKSGMVKASERKYAKSYEFSPLLKAHKSVFTGIKKDLGKSK